MNENLNSGITPRTSEQRPRHRLRLAAIGGMAAIVVLGGGITAVASAGEPASGSATPSVVSSTSLATTPAAAAPTRPAPKPHLAGTVTSVSGSTVLIKDRDGFTRTIVLSSKTTYDDGLNVALATGTKIHAQGTVDANGTSLDATTVGAEKAPMGGPGRGGRGPWGGHGWGGHGHGPAGGPNGTGPGGPTGGTGAATPAPKTSSSAQPGK